MRISIESRKDFSRLHSLNSWLGRPYVRTVSIVDTVLDDVTRNQHEKRLRFLFNDCGCFWAAPASIASVALLYFFAEEPLDYNAVGIARAVLIALAAAMFAKFGALWWSHIRLRELLSDLEKHFERTHLEEMGWRAELSANG